MDHNPARDGPLAPSAFSNEPSNLSSRSPPFDSSASPEPLSETAAAISGAAEGLEDGLRDPAFTRALHVAADELTHLGQAIVPENVRQRVGEAGQRIADGVERAQERVTHFAHETRVRTDAIAESGRRAVQAPGRVTRKLGQAGGAWLGGFGRSIGMWAGAAAIGLTGLIVLTIGLTVGLNMLLGAPWGFLIVAGLYAVGALMCVGAAKRSLADGRRDAAHHMGEAQEELDRVGRPIQRAFSRPARPLRARSERVIRQASLTEPAESSSRDGLEPIFAQPRE